MMAASILLKATVVVALALAGTRLARRSRASVRHVLLASAFVVLLILPIATMWAPSVRVAMPAAVQEAIVPLEGDPFIDATSSRGSAAVVDSTDAVTASRFAWPSLSEIVLMVWIAGTTVFLLPVIVGLWQVRALRRSGLPWREGRALVDTLATEAGMPRRVDVLLHEALSGPMTCGVIRPAIVFPIDAQTWTQADLRRAFVHELEHVRRCDWMSQCLAPVVSACYWFHPIVWVAWRQLSLEAERACDDAVLCASEATAYADQLVQLAQRLSAASHQPQLAMANRHDLVTRVGAVLDSRQRRGRPGAMCLGAAIAVAVVLTTGLASIRIVAAAHTADDGRDGRPEVRRGFNQALSRGSGRKSHRGSHRSRRDRHRLTRSALRAVRDDRAVDLHRLCLIRRP